MSLRSLAVVALGLALFAPHATRAADEENPFKKAKVGDYAKYNVIFKSSAGEAKSVRTQTVTAASEKEVSLKTLLEVGGKEQPSKRADQKIDLTKPFDPVAGESTLGASLKWEKQKDGKEKVKVGDKEYDCTWTTYKPALPPNSPVMADSEVKVWMSKDVPFVVKRTLTMRVANNELTYTTELVEFGNKK